MIAATKTFIVTSGRSDLISRITVIGVRVSTVSARWGIVHAYAYQRNGRVVGFAANAALHRDYLTGRWTVVEFGSNGLGCPMPPPVRRDLRQHCLGG
jgi:hypothetical protein